MTDIIEKDKNYVWHPFTQALNAPDPIVITAAKGAWLFDADGKKYLDANSSWWTINHGHAHPYLAAQIHEQFLKMDHVIFAGATHPKAVETAERIVNCLPDGYQKVFFSDNGSTSVEVGIKMIYQYWHNKGIDKKRFLAIEGAYHGDTFGAMSVGQRGYFNKPFEHLFFDVDFIPFPTIEIMDSILAKIEDLFATNDFAGFIFEPLVQGAAGMRIYDAEWLNSAVALAKKHNVLTIADEVMTGFYRTGTLFAINQISETPDIVCMSKGVTGGVMPVGLTVTTQEIFNAFLSDDTSKALLHGHSFTGNPLSCAAICASLDLFEHEETLQSIARIADAHQGFLKAHGSNPVFKKAKALGTILSLEVEVGEESSYFSDLRLKAYNFFLENNLLMRPLGNVIFINPPYCTTNEELNHAYEKVMEFLTKRN
ncbi:MAG: adenosylmethionine--8-amino-7-oxononanoate transaminase [Crocinitomix sp.]|nr:adenosylmethionine--8-amino-7-oxononanoate transaminase [Crocinitomix sp.]